jgi:glycosyltransferase involved in cell wall biosynthesis
MDAAQMAEQLRNIKSFHPQSIRQYLERNFSMEAMTRKYIELYREVTGISEARTPVVLGRNLGLEAA